MTRGRAVPARARRRRQRRRPDDDGYDPNAAADDGHTLYDVNTASLDAFRRDGLFHLPLPPSSHYHLPFPLPRHPLMALASPETYFRTFTFCPFSSHPFSAVAHHPVFTHHYLFHSFTTRSCKLAHVLPSIELAGCHRNSHRKGETTRDINRTRRRCSDRVSTLRTATW